MKIRTDIGEFEVEVNQDMTLWQLIRARLRWYRWAISGPLVPRVHNRIHTAKIDEASYRVLQQRWLAREPMEGCPPKVLAHRMAHAVATAIKRKASQG